jgi:hypothetical protein
MIGYAGTKFGEWFFEDIVEWLADQLEIDEIFSDKQIEKWLEYHAKDYGYVKEDED